MNQRYLIALGSNMWVPGIGAPRRVLPAAIEALESAGLHVLARSPVIDSAPVGPSLRRYANGAAVIQTAAMPLDVLDTLHHLEREFGRSRAQRIGEAWRRRALDLDIVLWSGGIWTTESLSIPHPHMRERAFVLGPASAIAGDWRDPVSGLTVRQLHARLKRPSGTKSPDHA